MQTLLELHQVSKVYGTHRALDLVSMQVPAGSVFGLLGPNGAGKTSLLRIINRITGPDSGEVYFLGERLNARHSARIGYLPEERGLYKKMEVGEQALYLAQLKGMSRQEALRRLKDWFERFEMKDWWKKRIEELSKGMQQKVQFIVTVLHEPELLVLDEPFTGFDPINAELIRKELESLQKKGTTILLSTHRMESVESMCSHIALIDRSKKLLEGPVRDIRAEYRQHIYELDYSGAEQAIRFDLPSHAVLLTDVEFEGHRRARLKLPDELSVNSAVRTVINNHSLISLREEIPSMQQIFIQHVNQNRPHA
ncbi:MAG: ABC transporter ATP-binding protein [Bacteroidota bacterium]|jgi:ABC-2 type transport system ATP-binding protein